MNVKLRFQRLDGPFIAHHPFSSVHRYFSGLFSLSPSLPLSGSPIPGKLPISPSTPTACTTTPENSTKLRGPSTTMPCSMRLPIRPIPPSSMSPSPHFHSDPIESVFPVCLLGVPTAMEPRLRFTLLLSLTPLCTTVARSLPASRT